MLVEGAVLAEEHYRSCADTITDNFWKILRKVKSCRNERKQPLLYSADGLTPIIFGFLIHAFAQNDFSLATLIVFGQKTMGTVEISDSLFFLLSVAFGRIRSTQLSLKSLHFVFCDCLETFFAFDRDERLETRNCRCSATGKNAGDWNCSFGCCSEYLDYASRRTASNSSQHEFLWATLPFAKIRGSSLNCLTMNDALNAELGLLNNQSCQSLVKLSAKNSAVICVACETLLMVNDYEEETASFSTRQIKNYDIKYFL